MQKKSIFWFRQDLRVYDNTWLFEAVYNSKEVLPIFILDEHIIEKFWWLSDQKFGFLREALEQVSRDLQKIWWEKVIVFKWKPEEIIPKLAKKYEINTVFTNTSYGTYGKKRDETIINRLLKIWVSFESHKDFLLSEPQEIEKRKVFTPYYKLWQKQNFETQELEIKKIHQLQTQEQTEAKDFIKIAQHPYFTMEFWKNRFEKHIVSNYTETRNDLDIDWTSRLSPYLRFGVFSVRQIYNKAKTINEVFVSEIAWREFWNHIFYYFPFTKDTEFLEKRRNIKWSTDNYLFEKWCKWETGYPVVDAAMKQLNETNWMHGRARMVVASFLTKDLHIDWRLWEAYFREKLLDYDEAVNIWNWQWSASVWADPKPLRIFSPILQSQKFDKNALFIKKYIPELQFQELKAIHNPLEKDLQYIKTIVDHREEQKKTKEIYKKAGEK